MHWSWILKDCAPVLFVVMSQKHYRGQATSRSRGSWWNNVQVLAKMVSKINLGGRTPTSPPVNMDVHSAGLVNFARLSSLDLLVMKPEPRTSWYLTGRALTYGGHPQKDLKYNLFFTRFPCTKLPQML